MNPKLDDQSEPRLTHERHGGTAVGRAADAAAADLSGADAGRRCTQVKPDGDRCQAQALTGSLLCFFHDPAQAAARAAASRRGGEKNRPAVLAAGTPDAPLTTAADLTALLGRTINQVLRGQVDPKVATTVGYLLTVMMKAADLGRLEQRLAALEQALTEKHAEPSLVDPDEFGGA